MILCKYILYVVVVVGVSISSLFPCFVDFAIAVAKVAEGKKEDNEKKKKSKKKSNCVTMLQCKLVDTVDCTSVHSMCYFCIVISSKNFAIFSRSELLTTQALHIHPAIKSIHYSLSLLIADNFVQPKLNTKTGKPSTFIHRIGSKRE